MFSDISANTPLTIHRFIQVFIFIHLCFYWSPTNPQLFTYECNYSYSFIFIFTNAHPPLIIHLFLQVFISIFINSNQPLVIHLLV